MTLTIALATMLFVAGAAVAYSSASLLLNVTVTDHLGVVCLLALSQIFSPLHHVFELLLVGGLVVATVDRIRSHLDARKLLDLMPRQAPAPQSRIDLAASDAGLAPSDVVVLADSPVPAFTFGTLRPRVYVSDRLEEVLSDAELRAVLSHEKEHVVRRDPLRFSIVRFFARLLFWLPLSRVMEAQLAEDAEVRADARAARYGAAVTASALLALVRHFGRNEQVPVAVGVSQGHLLPLRLRLLLGENAASATRISTRALVITIALLLLFWAAALAELHGATHRHHLVFDETACAEHDLHPMRHYFCSETDDAEFTAAGERTLRQ